MALRSPKPHSTGQKKGGSKGKTSRSPVPGFKVTSSLVCHGHTGTAGCSDCSNSCWKTISSGRTFVLGVPLVTHWGQPPGQAAEDGEQKGLLVGRQTQGCRLTPARRCQHPLLLHTKMVQPGVLANVSASFQFF